MNEMVLFNPGDSIGNFHDYNEAVRTAQIYQERHTDSGHVLVVKSEGGVPSFDIFIADQQPSEKFPLIVHPYLRKRLLKVKQSSFENLLFKADAVEEMTS